MESTGNMARIGEHGSFSYEGVAMDMPLVTRKSRDEFRSPTPPPPPVGRNQKKPSVPRFNSPSRGPHQSMLPAPSVSGSVTDPSVVRLLEELYSTINYADKRCFVLDGQVEKANDQLARLRKKLQEVKPAKEAAERRAVELEQLEQGYKNEINALRAEIHALKSEIKDLKKHIKDMSGDQRAGIKSVAELEAQMAKMRDEINAGRRDRGYQSTLSPDIPCNAPLDLSNSPNSPSDTFSNTHSDTTHSLRSTGVIAITIGGTV